MFHQPALTRDASISTRGFTIIEVLIALAIFSIGMLAVSMLQINGLMSTASARRVSEAMNIAQTQAETLMAIPFYLDDSADWDGNGCNNRYEFNADLRDGNYQLNADWTGEYTVFWTISEGPIPCEGVGTDPDGNPCDGIANIRSVCTVVLSKAILIEVARTNNPGNIVATLNLVKTGVESTRLVP